MSQTVPADFTINSAQQGKFQLELSNLPFDPSDFVRDIDLRRFNQFVHGVSIPETTLNLMTSRTYGGQVLFPAPDFNRDIPEFTVTYGLDENMSNYWYLFNWTWANRNAKSIGEHKWLKNAKINEAVLGIKDNNGRARNYVKFIDCYVNTMSGLDLTYGNYEDLRFTVNFKFNGLEFLHFGLQSGTM